MREVLRVPRESDCLTRCIIYFCLAYIAGVYLFAVVVGLWYLVAWLVDAMRWLG